MAKSTGGQGVVLGYLKYVLGFDSLAFEQGLGDADKRLKAAQRSIQKTADKFANIGVKMSAAITAPLIGLAAAGINEARETAAAMAQVQASLDSMGPVAGRTADQLSKVADQLEKASLFEADQILGDVTAKLLTFGKVQGEVFDRAQQAAVDLATKFKTDLGSAALQIGKALQDPVKGITALSRAGVSFDPIQKEQIKNFVAAGETAKAQAIILGELERQVGGAAQAAQNADPWNKLSDSFKSLSESIGTILLPIIPPLADALAKLAGWFTTLSPETQKWIVIAGGIAAILGPAAIAIGAVVSGFGAMLPLLTGIGPVVAAVIAGFTTFIPLVAAATKALALMALTPIGAVITGIAVAVGAVYLAWKNWDRIVEIVRNLYNGVKLWLQDKLGGIFKWVNDQIELHKKVWYNLYDAVVGHSYIPDMVDEIGVQMARLDGNMVQVAARATASVASSFAKLEADIQPIMDRLFPERVKERNFLADREAILGSSTISEADRKKALARLADEKGDWFAGVNVDPKMVTGTLEAEWAKAEAANDNLARSFEHTVRDISGSLQSLGQAIKSGDWLDILGTAIDAGMSIYSAFKGVKFGGARAMGGAVNAGSTYMVGERGPEMFTASRSGYIHPNAKGAAQRPTIVQLVVGPGQFFEPAVTGISGNVAVETVSGFARGSNKRVTRRLA